MGYRDLSLSFDPNASLRTPLRRSPPRPTRSFHVHAHTSPSRDLCLKAFVIFVIVSGAIALVSGVLALLASQGVLTSSLNSLSSLTAVGPVNSAMMIASGFVLFVLGIVAWTCQLRNSTAHAVFDDSIDRSASVS